MVWRLWKILTVHGDVVSHGGISAFSLNGHLRSGYSHMLARDIANTIAMETLTASRQKSIAVNAPLLGLNVVGNGLDQIAVGSTHADPEREEAVVVGLTGLG